MEDTGVGTHTHEAILQLLNRQVGDCYFPAESFENADAWNDIPIVYAAKHPDLDAFSSDPQAELKRIAEKTGKRAEIIGRISNARLEKTGHPKLMSDMVLDADPEVFQLIEAGKLSHSTGFWAKPLDGSLKGSVVPNHLLVFEEDETNQPRDRGAVILNKIENDGLAAFTNEGRVLSKKNNTAIKGLLGKIWDLIDEMTGGPTVDNEPPTAPEPKTETPVTNMTEEIVASKDAEITALKNENAALKEQNVAMLNKISEHEQEKKGAQWVSIKNKIPPGVIHTPEKEAETKALFEKDPVGFMNMILETRVMETTKAEGAAFTNQEDANDPLAISRELRRSTGRIR